jgi:hypothetical protein
MSLTTFKKECLSYLNRYKKNGGKLATITCCECLRKIKTPQPSKDEVSQKGYWDTMKKCYECGSYFFVKVYPSGHVNVKKLHQALEKSQGAV